MKEWPSPRAAPVADAAGVGLADRMSPVWLIPLLPAGFVLGLVGGFLQESRVVLLGLSIPFGALLVLATLVSAVRALNLNLETKAAGALFYAGWLIASAMMAAPTNSGDVVFAGDRPGPMLYLISGALLGAATAAWPLSLTPPKPELEGEGQ